MSDEQFLARWSRRKQEAKAGHAEPAPEDKQPRRTYRRRPTVPRQSQYSLRSELSNLPPIESIDAATDITAFLRKGIPQELSRAALRRAWSADPAIRDFVGLAENAWDFNDPNAMPGFGPLDYSAEQVDALVRRIVGGVVGDRREPPHALRGCKDAAQSAPAETGLARNHRARRGRSPDPSTAGSKSVAAELPS